MAEIIQQFSLLSWNVRGLNSTAKQEDVKQMIQLHKPMSLQETKMEQVTTHIVSAALGHEYAENFYFLPADGTRGGVLLASSNRFMQLSNVQTTTYTISATVSDSRSRRAWTLIGVYGPQHDFDKHLFPTRT